jgi:hypothetical protein
LDTLGELLQNPENKTSTKSQTTDFDYPRLKVAAAAAAGRSSFIKAAKQTKQYNRHTLFSIFDFCFLAFFLF